MNIERLTELLGCMENAIQKGDEMHLCFETNMSKADAVLIQAWNGPLGIEVLEIIKYGSEVNFDCDEVITKINALGKPEPEKIDYKVLEKLPIKMCSFQMNNEAFTHHMMVITEDADLSKMFNGNSYKECVYKACKDFGIDAEA